MSDSEDRSNSPAPADNQAGTTNTESTSEQQTTVHRDEQLANAVAFLSHPKVRGSPIASKRQFLKNKGLTDAEIDEAFRRVPETSPVSTTAPPPAPSSTLQTTANHLQPAPYTTVTPYQQQQLAVTPQQPPQQPIHWPQVLAGAGFTAAGAYAVKSLVWPYVADTYKSWRGTSTSSSNKPPEVLPSPEIAPLPASSDNNVDATAALAVAEAIKEQTSELRDAIQSIQAVAQALDKKSKDGDTMMLTANDLRQELRAFAATLSESNTPSRSVDNNAAPLSVETELAEIKGLLADYLKTPRSGSRTPTNMSDITGGSVLPHSTLMSAVHKAAGQQQYPSSKTPPTGVSSQSTSAYPSPAEKTTTPYNNNIDDTTTTDPSPLKTETSQSSFHSLNEPLVTTTAVKDQNKNPSYMEVLEMLEKGQTPPGIRTDINDKPPNPLQPPPPPKMKPLPKPWEQQTPSRDDGGSIRGTSPSGLVIDEHTASSDTSSLPQSSTSKPSSSISFNPRPREPFSPIVTSDSQQLLGSSGRRVDDDDDDADNGNTQPAAAVESIYQAAVTPAPESPNVIAGRFSPNKSTGGSSAVTRRLALDNDGNGSSLSIPDGNGLGRPFLRAAKADWNPPPIPSSSLSSRGSVGARDQDDFEADV